MAEPAEESGSSGENSDATDPLSGSFDPVKALYSPNIKLPDPDAKQFNNLAEFENFLNKKDAKSRVVKKKEKLPGIIAQRAAMQAKENVRKAAILSKSTRPPLELSATQQRRQRNTNVLTNMDGFEKGPLSVLRRCVKDRLRVVVVVRAAVSVRSHCRGYVIAFDKHMNMALMDVDEKYIKPVAPNRKPAHKGDIKMKKDNRSSSSNPPGGSSTQCNSEDRHMDKDSSKSYKGEDRPQVSGEPHSGDLRHKLTVFTSRMKSKQFDDTHAMSDSDISPTTHSRQQTGQSQSDSETLGIHDSDRGKGKNGVKKKGGYTPFWPLYKQWTESRCYASYEIVERHVNQLFVRGDNVVSVSIAS